MSKTPVLFDYTKYDGRLWRKGITTGTCAAAAAKAAAMLALNGTKPEEVEVHLPIGKEIRVKLDSCQWDGCTAVCSVIKDGGDDPDVTDGLRIVATVKLQSNRIVVKAGKGVGTVTRPGLPVAVGSPAINPVPMSMIVGEVRNVLPKDQGAVVTISVPGGEKVAQKTLNPQLGIQGGISILGTSGIVEPMSEEAFKDSLVSQIKVAKAEGHKTIILTPGRMGQKRAWATFRIAPEAVVQMSNFVGHMLDESAAAGLNNVILFGHIGKLIKVSAGIFHTHNKIADGRMEALAAEVALYGDKEVVKKILSANTVEEAVTYIQQAGLTPVLRKIAAKASRKAERRVANRLEVGTIFTLLDGTILAFDHQAERIGRELGWQHQSG